MSMELRFFIGYRNVVFVEFESMRKPDARRGRRERRVAEEENMAPVDDIRLRYRSN
jgi:hypothetical protein